MSRLGQPVVLLVGVGLAACGGVAGGGGSVAQTTTVTTVACDGSTITTVVTVPADRSSTTGQGGAQGHITAQPGGGPTTPTPVPTPRIVTGSEVTFGDADSGATVVVRVGTRILIALGPAGAPFCVSAPMSSDRRVLDQVSSSSANDRSAHGSLIARAVGTATIEATVDPRCVPACGAASARWQVTVDVTS